MSLRHDWRFGYQASDLLVAAQERADHHTERCRWWTEQLDQAEADLQAKRAQKCRQKIKDHAYRGDKYARFVRAFALNPEAVLELDVSDIEFFGL